jgi:hypothetical protein
LANQSKHDAANKLLDQMDKCSPQADRSLDNVETEDMLGSAIVQNAARSGGCHPMLRIWTQRSDRRLLPKRCWKTLHTLLLQEENAASSNRDTIPAASTI